MPEIDLKKMGIDIFGNPGSLKRDIPEYKQYIQSKEWRIRRLQAIERDDSRCRVCNSGENLDVHHRTYKRLGDELSNDLTTLCEACHDIFTAYGRLARNG